MVIPMGLPELLSPIAIILKSQLLPPGIIPLSISNVGLEYSEGASCSSQREAQKLWNLFTSTIDFQLIIFGLFDRTCRRLEWFVLHLFGNIF